MLASSKIRRSYLSISRKASKLFSWKKKQEQQKNQTARNGATFSIAVFHKVVYDI